MVISLPALDCMRYPLKSESILTCLRATRRQMQQQPTGGDATDDQTWMPPSFVSLLHMRCMFSSVNLMMHFFCSFSMDWIIPAFRHQYLCEIQGRNARKKVGTLSMDALNRI